MSKGISYEEYLEKNGSLTYSNVGVSMMPMLREGKDLFKVRKKDKRRCCRGDVVLYRRPPDKYVLHRVIEVRPNDYVILGDNCVKKEYGIKDSDIIGVMTGFVRNGREYTTKDLSYVIYKEVILNTVAVRIIVKRIMGKLRKKKKKVLSP